jgi:hypothetical protein
MSDNNSISQNSSTGLLTSIWGSDTWNSLHCITFGYPECPTEEDKQHYKTYFETLKYVLPCCTCRKHLTEHTGKGSKFEINNQIFESRATLTKWLYDLHNYVDKTLDMKYDITYEDLCEKYGSYIADCKMSQEKKVIAYSNAYDRESTFMSYEIAECFSDYAIERGLENFEKILANTYNNFKNKRTNKTNWKLRNIESFEIIKNMRVSGKLGFETEGQYKNLPTIEELKLFQLMSTTLKETSLEHMIEKLGFKIQDKFSFLK